MEQLRATAARLEPQAAEAGVQLNIKGDDDLVINGEADQIDSAVTKLIENAIGYSKENGVVSVSASKDKDGDRAVIRVIDQGTGIAKKDQARIFERFYRGVEQSNRTADGVGLGLAIVKHVALTHHGDVTVWSAPGQGSTFSLTLPLALKVKDGGACLSSCHQCCLMIDLRPRSLPQSATLTAPVIRGSLCCVTVRGGGSPSGRSIPRPAVASQ